MNSDLPVEEQIPLVPLSENVVLKAWGLPEGQIEARIESARQAYAQQVAAGLWSPSDLKITGTREHFFDDDDEEW